MRRAAHQVQKSFVVLKKKICGKLHPLHRHGSLICFGRDVLHFSRGGDRLWGWDLVYLNSFFEITAAGDIDVCDASAHAAFNLYVFYCWSHVTDRIMKLQRKCVIFNFALII